MNLARFGSFGGIKTGRIRARCWTIAALAAAATFAGAAGSMVPKRHQKPLETYQHARLQTIQAQLEQIDQDYIVILGDSHAERSYLPSLCGLPVINAGVSGSTAADVLALAERAHLPRKAAGTLLFVGTNDTWKNRRPDEPASETRFRTASSQLLRQLSTWSDRVVVSAIAPVALREKGNFSPAASARFTTILEEGCKSETCSVLRVFAKLEEGDPPEGAFTGDGVHLTNYATYLRAQEPAICRRLGLRMPATGHTTPR